jgi:hypothetical protein
VDLVFGFGFVQDALTLNVDLSGRWLPRDRFRRFVQRYSLELAQLPESGNSMGAPSLGDGICDMAYALFAIRCPQRGLHVNGMMEVCNTK